MLKVVTVLFIERDHFALIKNDLRTEAMLEGVLVYSAQNVSWDLRMAHNI